MKTCTKCGNSRPLDQYARSATGADGLRTVCKACQAAYSAARYIPSALLAPVVGDKACKQCGEVKSLDLFHKNSCNKTDGRQARCKACVQVNAAALWRSPAPTAPPVDKTCRNCGAVKLLDQFHKDGRSKDGRAWRCIECRAARSRTEGAAYRAANREKANAASRAWNAENAATRREWWLKTKYDLTIEQYEALLKQHGGCCAICGTLAEDVHKGLRVDHDHVTGQVRGLLCHSCNVAIGLFKDDPQLLSNAIEYLASARVIHSLLS